ncbi:MAG: lactate utilization protein [Ruminococcaceae bacterium]|nr:lactate utilization protein [Oscillospiraceae bacterium]
MNPYLEISMKKRIDRTLEKLQKNNMGAHYVNTRAEALSLIKDLLEEGNTVTHGGSVTLQEIGVPALLKEGPYNYLDRSREGITPEEIEQLYRDTFSADVFLTSTNAITENGELYNVDGNGNRVSALIFGPKKVIVVAGYNKLVHNINDAVQRIKLIAAPPNCERLSRNTPCAVTGRCASTEKPDAYLCDGCASSDRICCSYVITAAQRVPGRIQVILVGESLGY